MKIKLFALLLFILISQTAYAKIFDDFKVAAQRGNAEAQLSIALRYLSGFGTAADKDEGYYWLSQAANNGNAEAFQELFKRARSGDMLAKKYFNRIYKEIDEEPAEKQKIIYPKQETPEDSAHEQSALECVENIFNANIKGFGSKFTKEKQNNKKTAELVIKNGFGVSTRMKENVKFRMPSSGQWLSVEQNADSSVSFFNPSITIYGVVDPEFRIGMGATLGIVDDRENNKYDFDSIYLSAKIILNPADTSKKAELYLLGEIGFSRIYADLNAVNKELQNNYGWTVSEKSKFSDIYYSLGFGFCVGSQIIMEFLYQCYSGGQNIRIDDGSSKMDGIIDTSYGRIAVIIGLKFDL